MSSIAESYNKKGALLYRDQLYADATITFSKGLELEPENVTILCNRSAAYEASNKSKEALKDAELALQLNPKYIKAYYRKSKALFLKLEQKYSKEKENTPKNIEDSQNNEYYRAIWEDILQCIEMGLEIDPEYKELVDYKEVILTHPKYLSCFHNGTFSNDNSTIENNNNTEITNNGENNDNLNNGEIGENEDAKSASANDNNKVDKIEERNQQQREYLENEAKPLLLESPVVTVDAIKQSTNDSIDTRELQAETINIKDTQTFEEKTKRRSLKEAHPLSFTLYPEHSDNDEDSEGEHPTVFPTYDSDSDSEGDSPILSNNINISADLNNHLISNNPIVGAPIMTSFVPNDNPANILSSSGLVQSIKQQATIQKTLSTPSSTSSSIATSFITQPSALSNVSSLNNIISPPFSTPPPTSYTNSIPVISSNSSIVTSFTPNAQQNPLPNAASHILAKSDHSISRSHSSPISIQSSMDPNLLSPPKMKKDALFPTSPPASSTFAKYVKTKQGDFVEDIDKEKEKEQKSAYSSPSPPSSPTKYHGFDLAKGALSPPVSPPLTPATTPASQINQPVILPTPTVVNNQSTLSSSAPPSTPAPTSSSGPAPSAASSLSASIMEPIAMVAKIFSQFSSSKDKEKKKEEMETKTTQTKENPLLPAIDLIEFGLSKSDPIETPEGDPNLDNLPLIAELDTPNSEPIEESIDKIELVTPEQSQEKSQESKETKINFFQNSQDPSIQEPSSSSSNNNNNNNSNVQLNQGSEESNSKSSLSSLSTPSLESERPQISNSPPDVFFYIQNDNAFNSKGVEFFKNRKYMEAINCFNHAIKINPHNYYYFINRAAAKLSNGDPHSALEDIENSIELYPKDATAYLRKAEIYFFMNSPKLAKQTLEEAMKTLSLSAKEKQDFDKGIKYAESKDSYIKDISIHLLSTSTEIPTTTLSQFFLPSEQNNETKSKSKLELTNFIKPVPVFRHTGKGNVNNSNTQSEAQDSSDQVTIEITNTDSLSNSPKSGFHPLTRSPDSSDNLLRSPRLSPRFKRSTSNPSFSQFVDQRKLMLVDQDGNKLSTSKNDFLFTEIKQNRFWHFVNALLQSGRIPFFPLTGNDIPIIFLPKSSALPAEPTPLDEYYESHFATISSVCRQGNLSSSLNGNENQSKNSEEIDCVKSDNFDENLKSDLKKNWPEKFTFKTLNHIEGIIEKNKITVLKNPFERMLGADGQEFSMKGPISIDIIAESYVSLVYAQKSSSSFEDSPTHSLNIPVKLFIIGTSIFPCEIEKIFTNFILLEEEIKEKMKKKDSAMALIEVYWKKYQDDLAADLRASIDKFTNEFRKKPPGTLEEKATKFKNFISTILDELKTNELWESAPKEEIDCAIFNLRKQILSQLTDLLRNENVQEDEMLKNLIKKLNFVTAEHLGLPEFDINDSVYTTAKSEMLAIDDFTSPREKLECLLHCCKIINYQITTMGKIANADELLPRLILLILHTNPPQLPSNLKFIQLFCDRTDELAEAFYYVTMVESAVYFIQNINGKLLNIPEELFEQLMNGDEIENVTQDQNATGDQIKEEGELVPKEEVVGQENNNEEKTVKISYYEKEQQDITTSDIPLLLLEYKKLVSIVQTLKPEAICLS